MQSIGNTAAGIAAALTPWPSQKSSSNAALCNFFTGSEAQERENNGPWVSSRLKKDSLFLTAAGAPHDFRWRTLTPGPFEVVLVLLSLPLFKEALEDVLVQMPNTLTFETFLASKIRSSFRSCKNCERRR